ncbi:DUF2020 domain-containing protein [Actinoalloteichus spitiensis]|uniref:DUF2020 domain-containing protein n=1 Tax=Actinoalloteichus spitiensis TaxID=252394 RepID=UPI0003817EEA|nr:DUF2020 domain-containing protein [Actinoalloteichus spitiensis]
MRRPAAAAALAAVALLAACSTEQPENAATPPPAVTSYVSPSEVPPPPVEAVVDGDCPYLPTASIEDVNGQRVASVRLGDDEPHPSCFFYRADGGEQFRVRVFVGEPWTAKALVDQEAPVADSQSAELPGGWTGGLASGTDGGVFAVYHPEKGTAVVARTNQQQSFPARAVVEEVIGALGL